MKKRTVFALIAAFVFAFMLAACSGNGTFGSEFVEETGAFRVVADDAPKDATVKVSGALTIEEGQLLLVSPDLTSGRVQLRILGADDEAVFDEEVGGRILDTYTIAPGEYTVEVINLRNGTTGTMLVFGIDEEEFAQENASLEEALSQGGIELEGSDSE